MSDNLKQLSIKAQEIFDITHENCDIKIIEKYYSLHNLWLHYSPVPSRPIFQTAWFEAGVLTETMIFLAFHGFYEQACATLRIQLVVTSFGSCPLRPFLFGFQGKGSCCTAFITAFV